MQRSPSTESTLLNPAEALKIYLEKAEEIYKDPGAQTRIFDQAVIKTICEKIAEEKFQMPESHESVLKSNELESQALSATNETEKNPLLETISQFVNHLKSNTFETLNTMKFSTNIDSDEYLRQIKALFDSIQAEFNKEIKEVNISPQAKDHFLQSLLFNALMGSREKFAKAAQNEKVSRLNDILFIREPVRNSAASNLKEMREKILHHCYIGDTRSKLAGGLQELEKLKTVGPDANTNILMLFENIANSSQYKLGGSQAKIYVENAINQAIEGIMQNPNLKNNMTLIEGIKKACKKELGFTIRTQTSAKNKVKALSQKFINAFRNTLFHPKFKTDKAKTKKTMELPEEKGPTNKKQF